MIKQKNNGIGLLELMLSLTIIAILLVSATKYYAGARNSQQVNDGAQMVIAVYTAGQNWLRSHDDLSGVTGINIFVNDGSVPKDFMLASANPWGGSIDAFVSPQSKTSLEIDLHQIPEEACYNLGQKIKAKIPGTQSTTCTNTNTAQSLQITIDMRS